MTKPFELNATHNTILSVMTDAPLSYAEIAALVKEKDETLPISSFSVKALVDAGYLKKTEDKVSYKAKAKKKVHLYSVMGKLPTNASANAIKVYNALKDAGTPLSLAEIGEKLGMKVYPGVVAPLVKQSVLASTEAVVDTFVNKEVYLYSKVSA